MAQFSPEPLLCSFRMFDANWILWKNVFLWSMLYGFMYFKIFLRINHIAGIKKTSHARFQKAALSKSHHLSRCQDILTKITSFVLSENEICQIFNFLVLSHLSFEFCLFFLSEIEFGHNMICLGCVTIWVSDVFPKI